jgi:hypothetical protein
MVDLGDIGQEIQDTTRITPLVIVPGDEFNEMVVQGDTSLSVEDGGVSVAVEIGGDDFILGVSEDACRRLAMSQISGIEFLPLSSPWAAFLMASLIWS